MTFRETRLRVTRNAGRPDDKAMQVGEMMGRIANDLEEVMCCLSIPGGYFGWRRSLHVVYQRKELDPRGTKPVGSAIEDTDEFHAIVEHSFLDFPVAEPADLDIARRPLVPGRTIAVWERVRGNAPGDQE